MKSYNEVPAKQIKNSAISCWSLTFFEALRDKINHIFHHQEGTVCVVGINGISRNSPY